VRQSIVIDRSPNLPSLFQNFDVCALYISESIHEAMRLEKSLKIELTRFFAYSESFPLTSQLFPKLFEPILAVLGRTDT
jgi:hypothetical protein